MAKTKIDFDDNKNMLILYREKLDIWQVALNRVEVVLGSMAHVDRSTKNSIPYALKKQAIEHAVEELTKKVSYFRKVVDEYKSKVLHDEKKAASDVALQTDV